MGRVAGQSSGEEYACDGCGRVFGTKQGRTKHRKCCAALRGEQGGGDADGASAPGSSSEDDVYQVEHLVDERVLTKRGKRIVQYLVKWEGYSHKDNSWEDEAHILDEKLIDEMRRRKAKEAQAAAKDARLQARQLKRSLA